MRGGAELGPGIWLVQVVGDNETIMRVGIDEMIHGGPARDFPVPGIHAWLNEVNDRWMQSLAEVETEEE